MKDKKIKKNMDDPLLIGVEEEDEEYSALARLIELGRQKSYVTIDDILHFFPEAEQDVEQLEEAFAALLSAGIPFIGGQARLREAPLAVETESTPHLERNANPIALADTAHGGADFLDHSQTLMAKGPPRLKEHPSIIDMEIGSTQPG